MRMHWIIPALAAILLTGCADEIKYEGHDKDNEDGTIGHDIETPQDDGNADKNPGADKNPDENKDPDAGGDSGKDPDAGGDSGKDPDTGGDSGKDPDTGGDSGKDPDADKNPDENTGRDPECTKDEKKCSQSGEVMACLEGKWQNTPCDGICEAGECIQYVQNSCDNPLIVTEGTPQSLSTNTGTSYPVSAKKSHCSGIVGPHAAARLDITETAYYSINVTSKQANPVWGLFESRTCAANNFYQNDCLTTGDAAKLTMTRLLVPGPHYVFIGGLRETPSTFDFDISVSKTDASHNACGYAGPVEIIDPSQKTLTLSGSTATGTSNVKSGDLGRCGNSSAGKEIAYAFQITSPVMISADMQITRDDGTPCVDVDNKNACASYAVVHVQRCSDSSTLGYTSNTLTCGIANTPENGELIMKPALLTAGEYMLFVDSESNNSGYAYKLQLTFENAG